MINHIFILFCKSTIIFIAGLFVTILGLPIIAVALPFRKTISESKKFTQYQDLGEWALVTLPWIFKPWSNEFDGAYGDKRGWWANYCIGKYGKNYKQFLPMWLWLAIRNPANYWSRVITGVDVSKCTIRKLAGDDIVSDSISELGWQFLVAEREDGKLFHSLRFAIPWFFSNTHIIYGWVGWKLKLSHNDVVKTDSEADRIKGSVYKMSFWKEL